MTGPARGHRAAPHVWHDAMDRQDLAAGIGARCVLCGMADTWPGARLGCGVTSPEASELRRAEAARKRPEA